MILSEGLWRRRFGADPKVLGATIEINRESFTVVGIMPPAFQFLGQEYELWTPLALDPDRSHRNFYYLNAIARLNHGVSIEQARTEMNAIVRQLAVEYPGSNQGWGASVVPLRDELVGKVKPAILLLLGAVAFVLLIACANVANLLMVRASGKRREFAIRAALGAGRSDIVGQLLSESMLLAAAGGALGVLLAHWTIQALLAFHPADFPRLDGAGIDLPVLGFTLGISLLTGILFGLAPAIHFSRVDLNDVLKEGSRGASAGRRSSRTRSALVIIEVALSLILLDGAGLMIRSFAALASARTGFRTENLLTMNVTVAEQEYRSEQQEAADFERMVERVQAMPGVLGAATSTNLPVGGWNQGRVFTVEGRAPEPSGEMLAAGYLSITPDYFRTIGLPLEKGRGFTADDRHGAPAVVIISDAMARRFWPGADPLGKRIVCASHQFQGHGLGAPVSREIVGVVGDVKHLGQEDGASIEMYVPQMQNTIPFTFVIVRTAGNPMRMAASLTKGVNEILKESPVAGVTTIEDRLAESFSRPRFQMLVLGAFAVLALLLATLGIYGVIAYSAAQRTSEIGIRMALGANGAVVLRLILGNGLKLAGIGVAMGLAGAIACARLLGNQLYSIRPTDALTLATVSVLLLATALLASVIPAWRASKTDPAVTLRS